MKQTKKKHDKGVAKPDPPQPPKEPEDSSDKKRLSIKDVITIVLAALAFVISLATYYQSRATPYNLSISPPAITQANDDATSLIVDIMAYNSGARPATIENIRIRTSAMGEVQELTLYVQDELNRQQQLGTLNLDNERTQRSVFLPQVVRPNDVLQTRLHFKPWQADLPVSFAEVLATDMLFVDIQINGKWHNQIFELPYPDFRDKFKPEGVVNVPKDGYAPRWFLDESSFVGTGGFWSNQ